MILPGKYLQADRSLVAIGGEVLGLLNQPRSVSDIWRRFQEAHDHGRPGDAAPITYDWFILALTFLNAIAAIRLDGDMLQLETVP